jgi:hypothetical protein
MKAIPTSLLAAFQRYPRAFICLGLSLLLVLVIYFRAGQLPQLRTTYDTNAKTLEVMIRNQTQGAELAAQLGELKRLTAGMNDRLMRIDAKASNYQFFYDIEARSRAAIAEVRQLTANAGDGTLRPKLSEFSALGFELTVGGRVGYVMSFLKRLESAKYFVRASSVVFKGDSLLGPDGVEATLKLEVLSSKP